MNITAVEFNNSMWNSTINFAENCSWKAGPFLAREMKENKFTDWERVFIAIKDDKIIGYSTIRKTDCIPHADYSPYIGFVFVHENYRGRRISEQLINFAITYGKDIGFKEVFLVSNEIGLYEKYGFIKIDEKNDIWGNKQQLFKKIIS